MEHILDVTDSDSLLLPHLNPTVHHTLTHKMNASDQRRGTDTFCFTGHGWLTVNTGHVYIFLTEHRAQVPASDVT